MKRLRRSASRYRRHFLPKAFELRVTVIGNHVLTAKILSQHTENGRIDWRRSQDELLFEAACLPPEIEARCILLLKRLGLVFGCFDFVVTPAGEYVFLEGNEMGQFLFVERRCGVPLLDAFSDFLLQARVDFSWDPVHPRIRYTDPDVEWATLTKLKLVQATHRARPAALECEE